ncbi:hypothetical protein ACA910_016550 [Epithemia clementina (nom. ined.)]
MLNGILYKSSMLVWKEKVKQDAICPPTYIHQKLGDETVFSYQGPSEATAGELPADQWQPYIHVMPHTEFPSGSSCLYTAFACVMQLVYGDNIDPMPTTRRVPPSMDLEFNYSSWSQIAQRCGEMRLEGVCIFTTSVPAGAALCKPLGNLVYHYVTKIASGIRPLVAINPAMVEPKKMRECIADVSMCGLNYAPCTNDANFCCPDYSRCRTHPEATCIAEHGECTNDVDNCCFGTNCVGNVFYRQCWRNSNKVKRRACKKETKPR